MTSPRECSPPCPGSRPIGSTVACAARQATVWRAHRAVERSARLRRSPVQHAPGPSLRSSASAAAAVTSATRSRLASRTLIRTSRPSGASPCTNWLQDVVACDGRGFVLTGPNAGADGFLRDAAPTGSYETSAPGVFAHGDVRSGSIKRCATGGGGGRDGRAARPRADVRRPRPEGLTVRSPKGRSRMQEVSGFAYKNL